MTPTLLPALIETVCRRITPSWPLDQAIAVNPYAGLGDMPIEAAARHLAHVCGSPMLMAPDWYEAQWQAGRIDPDIADKQARAHGWADARTLLQALKDHPSTPPTGLTLITDVIDSHRQLERSLSCRHIVTHVISQQCAAYFDQGQARWTPPGRRQQGGFYAHWLQHAATDQSPELLSGIGGLTAAISTLPDTPAKLIEAALLAMQIPPTAWEHYLGALLASLQGWASWCAYLATQTPCDEHAPADKPLVHLLAVRLAWDWILHDRGTDAPIRQAWLAQMTQTAAPPQASPPTSLWAMQEALERSYQQDLVHQLAAAVPAMTRSPRPALQAVFCIDVRSERMRRALEACSPDIQTRGFAGFFGLPIDFTPLGSRHTQAQLPAGLLKPTLHASEAAQTPQEQATLIGQRQQRLARARVEQDFKQSALSGFSFVETLGLSAAWALLRDSLALPAKPDHDGLDRGSYQRLRPVIKNLTDDEAVTLAETALRGMALTRDFAPVVLIVGHHASSANNPQVSSLHCGACCGHSGEVNARLLAKLLNRREVRQGLASRGIVMPHDTRFVAALHDTTLDTLTTIAPLPPLIGSPIASWLGQATERVQARHGATPDSKTRPLRKALALRGRHWAQTRPEWGLANNAAFIVAPRARTSSVDLQGRAFLHDYDPTSDPDGTLLTRILAGPLMVAHAINMHYNAAVLDNPRWGSGNKLLHNVVGGHIGVFEGNGGDLRTGLSLQSVHDGQNWMHTPQRLSVLVDAPAERIDLVLQGLPELRQLVTGRWLTIHRIPEPTRSGLKPAPDEVLAA